MYTTIWTCCVFILEVLATPSPKYKPSRWIPGPTNGSDALAHKGMRNLKSYLRTQPATTCTLKTAYRRKEWDSLKPREKRAYIEAVQCLQSTPSISGDLAPGARSRYDDFQATHINLTLTVHATVRYFTLQADTPQRKKKLMTHIYSAGQLPRLASLLHLRVRDRSPRRVWL